jgi:hypothetical protein
VYLRGSLSSGSRFNEVYAVLERGVLDFYESAQQFERGGKPLNSKSVRLWEYTVEKDVRKFNKALLGDVDFSMYQLMTSRVDLRVAAARYRFALMPKVSATPHWTRQRSAVPSTLLRMLLFGYNFKFVCLGVLGVGDSGGGGNDGRR